MNPIVNLVLAKYDEKTRKLVSNKNSLSSDKTTEKFSYFSNTDNLNNARKRSGSSTKCGDQTETVDFFAKLSEKRKVNKDVGL